MVEKVPSERWGDGDLVTYCQFFPTCNHLFITTNCITLVTQKMSCDRACDVADAITPWLQVLLLPLLLLPLLLPLLAAQL